MLSISEKQSIVNLLNSEIKTDKKQKTGLAAKIKENGAPNKFGTIDDVVEISDTAKAFARVDDFLNLGKPDRLNTDDMTPGEKEEFLKMLSILLKKGVVGYEMLEVDGKPEKHFIVSQIGDERLYDAKLYDENN